MADIISRIQMNDTEYKAWNIDLKHIRSVVPEAGIKGMHNKVHLTHPVGCNYLSLPLIPASNTTLLIYNAEDAPAYHVSNMKWFRVK